MRAPASVRGTPVVAAPAPVDAGLAESYDLPSILGGRIATPRVAAPALRRCACRRTARMERRCCHGPSKWSNAPGGRHRAR
jgi:hypothetical protein